MQDTKSGHRALTLTFDTDADPDTDTDVYWVMPACIVYTQQWSQDVAMDL